YSIFVQSQLNSLNFTESEATSDNDDEKDDDNMDMTEKAENIFNRFTEVKKLQKDYPIIFAYFPQDIIELFDRRLKQTYSNLHDEMMKLAAVETSTKPLKRKITIARALSALDDFAQSNCKFRELFLKHQTELYGNVIDIKPVLEAIEKHEYPTVASELLRIQQNIDDPNMKRAFDNIKISLSRFLNTLAKSTLKKVLLLGDDEVDLNRVTELVDNLGHIKEAQHLVIQFVDEVAQKEIEKTADKTKFAIGRWMKVVLDTFDASVNALNFLEAENKITLVQRIVDILGDYCEPAPLDSEGDVKKGQEGNGNEKTDTIISRVEKLRKRIENKLQEIVDKYKNIHLVGHTFNPYASFPPREIYEKLYTIMNKGALYKDRWKEIENDIILKTRQQLIEAREKVGALRPWEIGSYIRLCRTVLTVLPDHMKNMLEEEIRQSEKDVLYEMEIAEGAVAEIVDNKNANDINQFLDKCTANQKKMVEAKVATMARDMTAGIEQKWASEDTVGALKNLKELHNLKKSIKMTIPELDNYLKAAQVTFTNQVEKVQQKTVASFDAFKRCEVGANTIKPIENALDMAIECMNLKGESDELIPLNFEEKIKELDRNTSGCFTSLQQKYSTNFEQKNVHDLEKVLDSMKEVGDNTPFLQKIMSFRQKKGSWGIPENETTSALWTYSEAKLALNNNLEKMVRETADKGVFNETTIKGNDTERDKFFQDMKGKLEFMQQMSQCKTHVTNVGKLDECPKQLEKDIQEIAKKVEKNSNWTSSDCGYLGQCYKCFLVMKKHAVFSDLAKSQVETIDSIVKTRVTQLETEAIGDLKPNLLIPRLVEMKTMSVYLFEFKDTINKRIDALLTAYKKKSSGVDIAALATQLEEELTGVGKMIVAEHSVFKGFSVALFNQKTLAHGIDYVLEKIRAKGDPIDKSKLRKMYDEFNTKYRQFVQSNLSKVKNDPKQLSVFANNARMCARGIKQIPGNEKWDASVRDNIPEVMANIFALWTLQQAQYYHDAQDVKDQNNYLVQPHPAQVISIFRMLGVEEKKTGLTNHLIQIGTGEGKSVTLAVTCCVLALFGFDVSCTSYSEYLSGRDFKSFEQVFNILGVIDHIHYGTFNKICERIINEGGDVRKLVENLILSDNEKKSNEVEQVIRSKILLIDEVDVFFNKDFYGSCYSPAVTLRHDTITKLIDFIWKNKASLKFDDVKRSNEYKACCNILKAWDSLLDEAIKDMLSDIQNFLSHGYQVGNDKIGYKEQDGISYNIRYGYKTLFAYYHENAQNKISDESLKNNIFLSFQIGNFSYAEVPKNFYRIMGVSGTLETLSAPEQEVVEKEYHVSKHTYMPSLFGDNNLLFAQQKDISVVNENDYFITLNKEIDDRLVGKTQGVKRAVLVFFETKKQLTEFHESSNFLAMKDDAIMMTEDNSFEEKESLIKRATGSGQVGLFTKAFGRGTDFYCRDQIVSANGGAHVIQTFLSEELSEEVQIKGRTARQGESGSYSLVLCDKSLEKFSITQQDIQDARNAGNFYPMFNAKRSDFFKTQYAENKKFVEYASKEHELGEKLITAVKKNDVNIVKKMLCERNKGAEVAKSSRTVVLMDATGSMHQVLQNAKNAVFTMFERIATVLKDHGLPSNTFEMQFVVYRNYNAPEDMLLQASPWESKPANLRSFMESINAGHGMGNEAIEIGLAHVNKEAEKDGVSQVILIGDAPANTKQEVTARRQNRGENYWKTTKFPSPTYYEDELARLKQRGVIVHAFPVGSWPKGNFDSIARAAGGRCAELQVTQGSNQGSEQLTNLVSEEVLRNAGGSKGGALVDAYRAKFASKSHV
ncbi:hypothetical protein RFI_00186, partial [Reticulomyxa filosa]